MIAALALAVSIAPTQAPSLAPIPVPPVDPTLTGQALLDDLSYRTFLYFWNESHPETGLSKDRVAIFQPQDRSDNNVASIACTGFALPAYFIGAERGWITDAQARAAAFRVLDTLESLYRYKGWYYHFLNWETGERVWNCEISTIDTTIMLAGLLMAEQALGDPEFTRRTNAIAQAIDWQDMRTENGTKPDQPYVSMGYTPENGYIQSYWSGSSEDIMLYIFAYGLDPSFPESSWTRWERPVVTSYGYETLGGGPLFLQQMSHGFVDFSGRRDRYGWDYWISARNHALIQIEYSADNPRNIFGYTREIWGLSASDFPDGYTASGFPRWGNDDGTLAPAAAVATAQVLPAEAAAAAEAYLRIYPESYGRYGFTTGLNPARNWQSPDAIGIDIGQMMLSIENARDGLPHRWMMGSPIVQRGMERMGFRKTDEGPLESRPLRVP